MHFKVYLSDEGFGHIVRQRAIVEVLREKMPSIDLTLQTQTHIEAAGKYIPGASLIKRFNNIHSISGETTSGGRSRLPALLTQHQPRYVVIELGGNDALRGLPLTMTRDNLGWMTQAARQAGARVLLVGMQLPPNYGRDYGERFSELFVQVARQHQSGVVPFFLEGFAAKPDAVRYFQPDRIHPTEEAQPLMLATVWPEIRKLLAAR